jgi:protoporphyrinogen/coproporphyrinogen III oxidase
MIVIIGGGISGLALAHHLAARGEPYVLLEASPRVGGVMRSGYVQGHLLEWGPQRGRLTKDFAELVDEYGIRNQLITAPTDLPLYVYSRGKLRRVPFSIGDALTSDILPWSAKLRMGLEPFTAAARDDEAVADYFTRKLGREAYETLVGPLYGGLYASDPQHMIVGLSLGHILREFRIERSLLLPLIKRGGSVAPPAACSFREGMETLPRAIHERHRASTCAPQQRPRLHRRDRWRTVRRRACRYHNAGWSDVAAAVHRCSGSRGGCAPAPLQSARRRAPVRRD